MPQVVCGWGRRGQLAQREKAFPRRNSTTSGRTRVCDSDTPQRLLNFQVQVITAGENQPDDFLDFGPTISNIQCDYIQKSLDLLAHQREDDDTLSHPGGPRRSRSGALLSEALIPARYFANCTQPPSSGSHDDQQALVFVRRARERSRRPLAPAIKRFDRRNREY